MVRPYRPPQNAGRGGGLVTALITESGRFVIVAGRDPDVGHRYVLERADTATSEQGRAFHALLQEWYRTGLHSYEGDFSHFRDCVKRDLGAGFTSFAYADVDDDGNVALRTCERYEDVPEYIRASSRRNDLVRGRLKSWADYTKRERTEAIDRVISAMRQSGVNSPKFEDILQGMGADQ